MNFCLVSSGFPPEDGGGIGKYILELSIGLLERGHSVYVITKSCRGDIDEIISGIHLFRRKVRYFPKIECLIPGLCWSFYLAREINRLDKKYHFDVIEFPNWEGPGFWYAGKRHRKKVVTRVHTPYFESLAIDKNNNEVNFGDTFICWLEKKACQRSDIIISSTKKHRDLISCEYSIDGETIKLLPLGIKLDLETRDREASDLVEILYVSRLEPRKGTMTLIESIPLILNKYPYVRFQIVGKDRNFAPGGLSHKEYFLKNYPEYNDKVEFFGFLGEEELHEKYLGCDIFTVPSVYESFGLIYVEAMMHAKPVVAVKAGGITEVVEDGTSGILVEPNNIIQFVAALSELIEDKEKRLKMGRAGQNICQKKFDYRVMAERSEKIYFQ